MTIVPDNFTPDVFSLSIPVPALDIVILTVHEWDLCVVTTATTPGSVDDYFQKLPGGILRTGESLDAAFDRILQTKTGLSNVYKEQLITIGDPDRDTRGHVISIVYYALLDSQILLSSLDRTSARIIPIREVVSWDMMAYDHAKIIALARKRLEWKMEYTNIVQNLLPSHFSLSRLQEIYEIIFGHLFEKRHFQNKLLSTGMLHETGELDGTNPNPWAKLYEFPNKRIDDYKSTLKT